MSGDTPTYQLDCACCGDDVFTRDDDVFTDGETEHCRCCGSRVSVSADSEGVYGTTVDEDAGPIVARLLAGGTVLAAVVDALEDPDRPEESPVDAVRRLLAEVERLTPDTPGAVSDHVRSRFAEASAATLAGKGGCIGAGCIPSHQACEVLDAYDDARAELERLKFEHREQGQRLRAEVELLEDNLAIEKDAGAVAALGADIEAARLTAEVQKLRRDLCQAWGRDELGQRFTSQAARDRAARAVAKRQSWDCYPEDSTTDEAREAELDRELGGDWLASMSDGEPGGDQ